MQINYRYTIIFIIDKDLSHPLEALNFLFVYTSDFNFGFLYFIASAFCYLGTELLEDRRMVQWFRALTALTDESDFVPIAPI